MGLHCKAHKQISLQCFGQQRVSSFAVQSLSFWMSLHADPARMVAQRWQKVLNESSSWWGNIRRMEMSKCRSGVAIDESGVAYYSNDDDCFREIIFVQTSGVQQQVCRLTTNLKGYKSPQSFAWCKMRFLIGRVPVQNCMRMFDSQILCLGEALLPQFCCFLSCACRCALIRKSTEYKAPIAGALQGSCRAVG